MAAWLSALVLSVPQQTGGEGETCDPHETSIETCGPTPTENTSRFAAQPEEIDWGTAMMERDRVPDRQSETVTLDEPTCSALERLDAFDAEPLSALAAVLRATVGIEGAALEDWRQPSILGAEACWVRRNEEQGFGTFTCVWPPESDPESERQRVLAVLLGCLRSRVDEVVEDPLTERVAVRTPRTEYSLTTMGSGARGEFLALEVEPRDKP
jgi:hypothetical protein